MTTIEATPRTRLLHGLFTTALEGGIGYWSQCSSYRWSTGDGETDDFMHYHANIVDAEDDGVPYRIDRDTMSRGYTLATTTWSDRLAWSTEPPPVVVTDDTDWDYDAGDADLIVQLGLFGEVIYG
jgi:hypothetical protein